MAKPKSAKEDCDLFGEPIKPEQVPQKAIPPPDKPVAPIQEHQIKPPAIEVVGREVLPDRSIRTTILKT